ncbi:MAG: SDR family NAD(P)-dependent oxidoreductase [Myxococcaceae bacterium]
MVALNARRFLARYGPWALVAGASEGIGASFARALAAYGLNVVLIARRAAPLELLAAELSQTHRVQSKVLALDLTSPGLQAVVAETTKGLEVGLVVCNAALSLMSDFLELELSDALRSVDVNVRAPLVLAHLFGRQMVERGRGGLVLMSSVAGLIGSPYSATYSGSKAFALGFGDSLWAELGPRGVDVVTCVAGPTETPTYLQVRTSSFPPMMKPDEVASAALGALGKRPRVVAGFFNRLTIWLLAFLPRSLTLRMIAAQTKKFATRRH